MADGVYTVVLDEPAKPTVPAFKPTRFGLVDFDGVGDTSDRIDKRGFQVVEFLVPVAFTTATVMTFLVSNDDVNFVPLRGVSIPLTPAGAEGTTLLSGYKFFKIVLDAAEDKNIELSMI